MSSQETVTLSFLSVLFNARGIYILGYSWLFGMSVWVTFFGGVIAYRALPRQHFGALQHRTFPVYFTISLCITSALLVLWVFHHPIVLTQLGSPMIVDVAQVYALAIVIWLQGVNRFVIGPMTSRMMVRRQKLEKLGDSAHDNKAVSSEMKAVNQKFGLLHGLSSLANLGTVVVLVFHGLCLRA